ncbi:MAG TPA: radical SAM protein [Candidatus Eremiobacteraeota bacterium]|nr:MAG: (Dimethylallyl)adenosine tRNA methylthiotransferase MiaB [bacterium ADurb.Bin363]HPZ07640.1 radical SAM protein [Candidatus Eremiobacteraeota bacterium]
MKVLIVSPPSKLAKNVVRDFLYGCWCKGKRIGGTKMPPTSLLYVATTIKSAGYEVYLYDASAEPKLDDKIKEEVKTSQVVVMMVSTSTFHEDTAYLEELKKINKNIKTVIFGSHPTFMPSFSLQKKSVDFIIRKEPEEILIKLLKAIDEDRENWKDIPGTGYRINDEIVLNEPHKYIENLDNLPIPDRSFLPDIDYFNPIVKRMPYTTVVTSRGCPGKCIFCTVPEFYGYKVRARSSGSVIEELEMLSKMGYKEIFFRDETFTFYKKRNEEICHEMIKRKIDLTWICNARVGTVDKATMSLMKKAGCHMIKFGVESGVQEILDNIKKGIKVEDTRKVFKEAREIGLDTHAHIMLGCYGETLETIKETIKFAKEIRPSTVSFAVFTPYPGTELFESLLSKHPDITDGSECDFKKIHTSGFFNESFTSLKKEELDGAIKKAYRSFYFRPGYILDFFLRINSLDELKRVIIAGSNIFDFSLRGE